MSKINDGGPAFPEAIAIGPAGDVYPGMGGMTLRDWFAGHALAEVMGSVRDVQLPKGASQAAVYSAIAEQSYQIADAMLKARKAQP